MSIVSKRIPSDYFDRARHIAAQERAKAAADFFAALNRKLGALFAVRHSPADIHLRFHRGGLWRGI